MPRAKGKRVRRYAQVDIQREFEIRNAEREKRKKAALNRIYSEYDKKALEMRELVTVDGEENELQKKTKEELIIEMQSKRESVLAEFNAETDLKSEMIVSGIKKHCILGMIKYHQLQHNLFDDVKYHPETLQKFEDLNYNVENNLPV